MATTITSASTSSRAMARRRSSLTCVAFRASRSGGSTAHVPTPTESRSLRRPDFGDVALAPRVESVGEGRLEGYFQVVVLAMVDCEAQSDRLHPGPLVCYSDA